MNKLLNKLLQLFKRKKEIEPPKSISHKVKRQNAVPPLKTLKRQNEVPPLKNNVDNKFSKPTNKKQGTHKKTSEPKKKISQARTVEHEKTEGIKPKKKKHYRYNKYKSKKRPNAEEKGNSSKQ